MKIYKTKTLLPKLLLAKGKDWVYIDNNERIKL